MSTLFHSICKFYLDPCTAGMTFQAGGCHVSLGDAQETRSAFLCQITEHAHHGSAAIPYTRNVRQTPDSVSVCTVSKLCGWMSTCGEGAQISAAVLLRCRDMRFAERGFTNPWGSQWLLEHLELLLPWFLIMSQVLLKTE